MITEKEKWQFCEDKICPYCEEDISNADTLESKYITSCPLCQRSYVD